MWQQSDRDEWLKKQTVQRSYTQLILDRVRPLAASFEVLEYGALSVDPSKYRLVMLRSKRRDPKKPTVLLTGGVHGYETSGALGSIAFMETAAAQYEEDFNFACFPCVSPWAFETINRWNDKAIDPNRSFRKDSPSEECRFFLEAVEHFGVAPAVHFDLHETTDTDNTVFRPALAARDGKDLPFDPIPDGFYLVGAKDKPEPLFQKAIIDAVRKVTHIAPADSVGKIIGEPIEQEGVINYPMKELNLCAGATDAEFVTTTEVYPDSPKANSEICIAAQVAAIRGGLEFFKRRMR